IDRDRRRAVVMLSTVGGMDIEQVAATQPDKIARGWPDPILGLQGYAARALCFGAGVPEAQRDAVAAVARTLYEVFRATDAVNIAGGHAANFLDVGGGAKESVVKAALEIVLANPKVKSVFINIFGGITRGDEVAKGILDVLHDTKPKVPLVIRLSGTDAEAGRALLEGAPLVSRATMDDAAKEA